MYVDVRGRLFPKCCDHSQAALASLRLKFIRSARKIGYTIIRVSVIAMMFSGRITYFDTSSSYSSIVVMLLRNSISFAIFQSRQDEPARKEIRQNIK